MATETCDLIKRIVVGPGAPSWRLARLPLEVVARDDPDLIGSKELAFSSSVVGGISPVVNWNLDVGIELDDSVVGFVDDLGELDAGRQHHAVKAAVEWIGAGAAIGVTVRYDHLPKRRDLVEAEHVVQVVINDAGRGIDLPRRKVGLHDAGIAVEEALRVRSGLIEERLSPHDLGKILPGIVTAEQAAVEGAEQKVGAAGSDLVVAVEPGSA